MYGDELAHAPEDPEETRVRARPKRDRDATPRVTDRIDDLEKTLYKIGEQIERAADRLAPILQPEPPTPTLGEVRGEEPTESELSARVHRLTAHATHLGRHLGTLLDRVDL
jgi:hypothetical protein